MPTPEDSLAAACSAKDWSALHSLARALPVKSLSTPIPPSGWSPLQFSAAAGQESLLATLLSRGVKPDGTALCLAARGGSVECVEALVAAGVDACSVSRNGRSALHFAARGGCAGCVKVLVEAGADVDVLDGEGRSALSYAAEGGFEACAETIEQAADEKFEKKNIYKEDVGESKKREISVKEGWGLRERAKQAAGRFVRRASGLLEAVSQKGLGTEEGIGSLSPADIAESMAAHVEGAGWHDDGTDAVRRGVIAKGMTGEVLLGRTDPVDLAKGVLEAGGMGEDARLFDAVVRFIEGARAAMAGGALVQRFEADALRREVYLVVGAGVLFSLIVPMVRS